MMNASDLPVPVTSSLAGTTVGTLDPVQFPSTIVDSLPSLLVGLLERRYLSDIGLEGWNIAPREGDTARPLLREIVGIGRPSSVEEWGKAMPHVLTACHDPGHTLMMVLHGDGARHRLYLGARRVLGTAARSTQDYLESQDSAFKAYCTGLTTGPLGVLDGRELPELAQLLRSAPACGALVGIPSGRGGARPGEFQSLDRLVRAVGNQRYALVVVAEPVDPLQIDRAVDAARHLLSEVHASIRQNVNRTRGENTGTSQADPNESADYSVPTYLYGLAAFCQIAGVVVPGLGALGAVAQATTSMGFMANTRAMRDESRKTRHLSTGTNWSESASAELMNYNAAASEEILQKHLERLATGRSSGWWRTVMYIAAESEGALSRVEGSLRGIGSGDASTLEPLRLVRLPEHVAREAIERGQVLSLRPAAAEHGHPLGETYDAVASCITSDELATVVNLPQAEIPGLPMRELADFAVSVPTPADDQVLLGTLQDSLGHDLGPVTAAASTVNRHVFVTGMTGFGKTNTCMNLLLDSYNKLGVPFLVLEPAKAEYRRLLARPELADRLRVYSIGGESPFPLRLNPFSPVPGVPITRHMDLLRAVFNASFAMFAGMPQVLEEAITDIYTERGWSVYTDTNRALGPRPTTDEWSALTPTLEDLHDQIEVVLERKKYATEVRQNMGAALRSRLRSLMVGTKGLVLNTRRTIPLEQLFGAPTVIEMRNLGDDEEKAFVMALLFVLLYEYAEMRQHDVAPDRVGQLQHLTLIEEAHRLLAAPRGGANPEVGDPRGKAVGMFTDMLAEMRAYGEGFIIADQIPTKLAPETLKNSSLKIVHRLVAPDDRSAAGSCMNLTERQLKHLSNLTPGYAVVHDERIGEAVLIHTPLVDLTPKVSAAAAAAEPAARVDRTYLLRHAGCHACPVPASFYYEFAEHPRANKIAEALRPSLEAVLVGDADAAWGEWVHWREEQQEDLALGTATQREIGLTYCASAQAAYVWLELILRARNPQADSAGGFSPADRLRRERAARALADLLLNWSSRVEIDESARQAFGVAQRQVLAAVAAAPPRERPGCRECPVRCQALSFVAPVLPKLQKSLGNKVSAPGPAETRVGMIERVAELHLAGRLAWRDSRTRRGLLYCLLVHADVEDRAATDELLAALRGTP